MDDVIVYPTVGDVLAIHEAVVASDHGTEAGVRSPETVESALIYVSEGYFGEAPDTIHETAAHLMRLLAAEHPFVDGNKRTALNATALFYDLNDHEFRYDNGVRGVLRQFATDESAADIAAVVTYCRTNAVPTGGEA
jgi:death-on-curing protein